MYVQLLSFLLPPFLPPFLHSRLVLGCLCLIQSNPTQLVLGYTTLYFVLVLVVLAYAEPSGLPTPSIPVWGQEWPAYIFTLTGILAVMSSGLFVACLRCVPVCVCMRGVTPSIPDASVHLSVPLRRTSRGYTGRGRATQNLFFSSVTSLTEK